MLNKTLQLIHNLYKSIQSFTKGLIDECDGFYEFVAFFIFPKEISWYMTFLISM